MHLLLTLYFLVGVSSYEAGDSAPPSHSIFLSWKVKLGGWGQCTSFSLYIS